jgi:acyl-CoA dehydrogenase
LGICTRAELDGTHCAERPKTHLNGQLPTTIVAARTSAEDKYAMGLTRGGHGASGAAATPKIGLRRDTSERSSQRPCAGRKLLGNPRDGSVLSIGLAEERLITAVGSMAHAQAAFDLTLDFVKERKAFGRPVGTFQNSRFEMAQLRAELDATQCFIDQCVLLNNAGELDAVTGAEVKLLATELEGRVMDVCVQLHGGAGYMEEYRISRMFTDARVSRILAGSNEIMREIIGRSYRRASDKIPRPSSGAGRFQDKIHGGVLRNGAEVHRPPGRCTVPPTEATRILNYLPNEGAAGARCAPVAERHPPS